jgi:hypothetical protein
MANWASRRELCGRRLVCGIVCDLVGAAAVCSADHDSGIRGWEVLPDGSVRTVDGESSIGTILPPR